MDITEVTTEGLRRQLKVVVGADELERRLSARLDDLKDRVRIKGFRPGHVPKAHLRKVYGRSVMAEVVQQAVAETSREAISQRQERPAFQPNISLPEDEKEIDKIFSGSADLAYTMSFEVLPKFDSLDFSKIEVEKAVAEVTSADIDKALDRLRNANPLYKPKEGSSRRRRPAHHRLQGQHRRRGVRGRQRRGCASSARRPQFHSGLRGGPYRRQGRRGARRRRDLPGRLSRGKARRQEGALRRHVKEVASPEAPNIDDDFAKALGLESLDEAARDGEAASRAGPYGGIAAEVEAGAARQAQLRL